MNTRTALRLGRVSNLPTVWTNVLAGSFLCAAQSSPIELAGLAACASLFYVAGMYLNDAFDHEIDTRERPERPIPSGDVSLRTVVVIGFSLLTAGAAGLVALGALRGNGVPAASAAGGLAGLIVLYDVHHKGSRVAPLVMGLCRAGLYVAVSAALMGSLTPPVAVGATALWAYVVGLTAIAAQENLRKLRSWWPLGLLLAPAVTAVVWAGARLEVRIVLAVQLAWTAFALRHLIARRIGDGVATLIAGICLVDALLVVAVFPTPRPDRAALVALVATGALALTRGLQSKVPGT